MTLVLEFKALDELFQDPAVQSILDAGVLNACIQVGVIVYFDHHQALVGLLQIHAIEAVANQARGGYRQLDHCWGDVLDGHRFTQAIDLIALRFVIVDLPMPLRHEVEACVERLSVEHPDTPIKLGIEVLLSEQQNRMLEQFSCRFGEFSLSFHFNHATRETAIRNFQHHGKTQAFSNLLQILYAVAIEDFCRGHPQIVFVEQVGEKHFVGAAQNRG